MTDSPRETRVLDAVVTLVDSLLDDFDIVDLLTELTERSAELLDVAAAGFLLADPIDRLRLVAGMARRMLARAGHPARVLAGDDLVAGVDGADAVLVLTEWKEFVELKPADLEPVVRKKVIVDGRRCLDPAVWIHAGWEYHGLGGTPRVV